jgi:hypothetical protein
MKIKIFIFTLLMNKPLLQKGLKKMSLFLLCCFIGPVIVHQAFKNQTHFLYAPVLIVGILFLITAMYYGFSGVKTLVNALLGERKTKL